MGTAFWLGNGVLRLRGGEELKKGDEVNLDKLSKVNREKLQKEGKIGTVKDKIKVVNSAPASKKGNK